MINIPIKQMWVEDTIIDKRCKKMNAWKITKEPNEKNVLVLYNISKIEVQNWVVQKIKGL
jgi:hypothetical protein